MPSTIPLALPLPRYAPHKVAGPTQRGVGLSGAPCPCVTLAFEREWGRESGERKGGRDREGGRWREGGREGGREGVGEKGRGEGEQQLGQTNSNLGKLEFMDSALQKPSQRHPPLFELNYPTESSQRTLHYYCWSTGPIQ